MTFGDGTVFGSSTAQGTGIIVGLQGIYGEPTSIFISEPALTLGSFGSGAFGVGTFGGLYSPDLTPIY